jgi:chitinase
MTKSKINCYTCAITLLLLLVPLVFFAQFRVVGYVPLGRQPLPIISDSVFKKLTHLNIAFINPDSAGYLVVPNGFDSLIQQAHSNKVKVLMAIGGGTFNPYYATLLKDENRKSFVKSLVALCVNYKLDGIDVDIENDAIDKNYEGLVTDLSAMLKPLHKLLTAALATWNGQLISDAALKHFDFINVMSYDQTGPWRPNEPGPHSTYTKAEEDLHYWTVTRGVAKKKVNLGLPFYGYCFGTTYGESMSYGNIVTTFPDAEQQDSITPTGGGNIYYNGIPTIQSKTKLALKNAGGIMIWQILGDAAGNSSLLNVIHAIANKK